jgi:hypothetical protein
MCRGGGGIIHNCVDVSAIAVVWRAGEASERSFVGNVGSQACHVVGKISIKIKNQQLSCHHLDCDSTWCDDCEFANQPQAELLLIAKYFGMGGGGGIVWLLAGGVSALIFCKKRA